MRRFVSRHFTQCDFYVSVVGFAGLGHLLIRNLGETTGYLVAWSIVTIAAMGKLYLSRHEKTGPVSN
jgi:hypothetical protein